MRLFHVSEERSIGVFEPRIPSRQDLDQTKGLVWAINEKCLPNFLTPRNCPRVCFHINAETTKEDKTRYLSSSSSNHVVVVENKWLQKMRDTKLYLYEFDSMEFNLLDENAGYYVSEKKQVPINCMEITDLIEALSKRNVELKTAESLWELHDEILHSTLSFSMCRMKFATPRGY
ncbi:DUF6886 family protein [Viridibacillus sp. FSL R5-0477]|uniref:Uncharacterized protein n=1 Tax=Viridibacillus arenosi FSL R5-213 TaxID=1227360 RepID=W4EK38_9BACL|nr:MULTISPECIES: DUF6886 family protein [Viridibacillus]ETT80948.1 hypothetical protein C176_19574 [Viridibacillus arenosi FSL R5-213]OMC83911.1 hypothetical protein BK130_05200 [Viridibacillus sp. FSL H8-0123]OMC88432.1 hypothetical protein BK128_00320 [Viridibacillus sp. FSL H7-0596]OMC93070.1 hypothetical protein BK137_00635 [Viridibacillus arenosi]